MKGYCGMVLMLHFSLPDMLVSEEHAKILINYLSELCLSIC
jgi:hypothetical protein